MTHLSTNFDRTGFQQDWNLVFPIDRPKELAAEGVIGSVAGLLHGDGVTAALLVPV